MFPIHVIGYISMSGLSTLIWAMLASGKEEEISILLTRIPEMFTNPALRAELNFWPYWIVVGWGALVVVHLVVVLLAPILSPEQRRIRRVRKTARDAASQRSTEGWRRGFPLNQQFATTKPNPFTFVSPPSAAPATTVLVARIDGSMRVSLGVTDQEWTRVERGYHALVARALAATGGETISAGDGVIAGRFTDPNWALTCAVNVQRELDRLRTTAGSAPGLAVCLHAASAPIDMIVRETLGLLHKASPGEILLTQPVTRMVSGFRLVERSIEESSPTHRLSSAIWLEPAQDGRDA